MLRILNIPQFSMYDNEGTCLLDSDSTCRVFMCLLDYLDACEIEYEITFLLPNVTKGGRFVYQCRERNVKLEVFDFRSSPIDNRYHFDFEQYKIVLGEGKYDIIFNHIIEITRNLRALLKGTDANIISFFHIIDFIKEDKLVSLWPNGHLYSYFWRQLDGELSSNYSVFNSIGNMNGWSRNVDSMNADINAELSFNRTHISYFFPEKANYLPAPRYKGHVTVFGNRITSSMYTNWHKAIDLFFDDDTEGLIFFSNPSNLRGVEALFSKYDEDFFYICEAADNIFGCRCLVSMNNKIYISVESLAYKDFLMIASKCHASMSLFEIEYYGGIAHRECIKAGRLLPIQPFINQFKSWYEKRPDTYFISSDELTSELFNKYIKDKTNREFSMNGESLEATLPNFIDMLNSCK